jgi:hypothetical protein
MASVSRWVLAFALAIMLAVAALSCGTCPSSPSITSVSPASAAAGGSEFVPTVKGDDFRHDSVVKWTRLPIGRGVPEGTRILGSGGGKR